MATDFGPQLSRHAGGSDKEPIERIKSPLKRGKFYQRAGHWVEAAEAFKEAFLLEEKKEKPRRNPFSRTFPGGGYRLDSRHRIAFAHAMAGDWASAHTVWEEAAGTDPAIVEWLVRYGLKLQNAGSRATAIDPEDRL